MKKKEKKGKNTNTQTLSFKIFRYCCIHFFLLYDQYYDTMVNAPISKSIKLFLTLNLSAGSGRHLSREEGNLWWYTKTCFCWTSFKLIFWVLPKTYFAEPDSTKFPPGSSKSRISPAAGWTGTHSQVLYATKFENFSDLNFQFFVSSFCSLWM